MPHESTYGVNLVSVEPLISPAELKVKLPMNEAAVQTVVKGRQTVQAILDHKDPRIMMVVGPCSIHDIEAGLDYATRLRELADRVAENIFVVMRVYFEKPRSRVGYKGLINDPGMDGTFRIQDGLFLARSLLLKCAEMSLPTAIEALDPVTPAYLTDLVSWAAIGARTTESQTHRELASGLSMPIGFKNGTDGNIHIAIDAIHAASSPHAFLGHNQDGRTSLIRTRGNKYCHVVLRGGSGRPNYDSVSVRMCEQLLEKAGLPANIMIDCSHANSFKNYELQPLVARDVLNQISHGNRSIVGLMLESNLLAGNQPIPKDLSELKYGVSVTDACIDWDTTEQLLLEISSRLKNVVQERQPAATRL